MPKLQRKFSSGRMENGTVRLTFDSANGDFDLFDDSRDDDRRLNTSFADASDFIVDIREYDVPYHVRVMIDLGKPSARVMRTAQKLTIDRYKSRKMVLRRGKTWRNENNLQRGPLGASRSSGVGVRY
jgi:DNA polymerase elongation subunit (family B)